MGGWDTILEKLTPDQRAWLREQLVWWRGVWVGMVYYEWTIASQRERAQIENLLFLVIFGDLLGVPVLPPHHRLRLLPFVVEELGWWRRRMMRYKEFHGLLE